MEIDITILRHSLGELFGRDIPIYGISYVVAIAVAALVALRNAKLRRMPVWEIVYSGIFAVIGGLVCAKLLSVLTTLHLIIPFLAAGGSLYDVLRGGFVFYGGLLGGMLGVFIYTKAYRLPYCDYADVFAPCIAIGHAIGRIGCLFAGCCYGKEVSEGFHFKVKYAYTDAYADTTTSPDKFYLPLPIIEALALTVIFIALFIMIRKTEKRGVVFRAYLLAYPAVRFVLEFFRGDAERGVYLGLSTSQYISAAIVIATLAYLLVKSLKSKKN